MGDARMKWQDHPQEKWCSDFEWAQLASRFTVGGKPPNEARVREDYPISIERCEGRQGITWAARRLGQCLNRQGEWEYEPQPSSRDEEFLARCRFETKEQALGMAWPHVERMRA
jgi:hypothetical protein